MECYQCNGEIISDGMIYGDGDDNCICRNCFEANMREAGFMTATFIDRRGDVWK